MKSADVGAFARDELRKTIQSFGRTWLRWRDQFCSWCRSPLTEDDIDAYAEWCVELGRTLRRRTTENRVPCRSCAGPAMSEIVDGIPFSSNVRPGTEPPDPWSRQKWSPQDDRERYP